MIRVPAGSHQAPAGPGNPSAMAQPARSDRPDTTTTRLAPRVREGNVDRRAVGLLQDFRRCEQPEVFQRLFEECGPPLLPLLRLKIRRTGLPADAGELLMDTFAQVYRARNSFRDRGHGSFLRWFLAIAENLLRQRQRESNRRVRREEEAARDIRDLKADPLVQLVERETQKAAHLTYHELRQVILAAMHQLSARQEQALLLHAVHRLSYAQIAARLDISLGAVAMRIKRARDRILEHVVQQVRKKPGESSRRPRKGQGVR